MPKSKILLDPFKLAPRLMRGGLRLFFLEKTCFHERPLCGRGEVLDLHQSHLLHQASVIHGPNSSTPQPQHQFETMTEWVDARGSGPYLT